MLPPALRKRSQKIWSKFGSKAKSISFPSLQSFLTCMGRFPFSKGKKEKEDMWEYHMCSPASLPFHITSCLVLIWLGVMLTGYTKLWINASPQQQTDTLSLNCSFEGIPTNATNLPLTQNRVIFDQVNRTITFVVFFLMFILNHAAQSINVVCRGNLMAQFLTEWEATVKDLGFKKTRGILLRLALEIVYTCAMFAFVVYLEFEDERQGNFDKTQKSATPTHFVRDTVKSVIIITLHPFSSDFESVIENNFANAMSTLFMFYVYISFKSTIIFYTYVCTTLSQMFKLWNERAKWCLQRCGRIENQEKDEKLPDLACHHFRLVQLVQNMDTGFGLIITTYFISLVGIVIFTIHFFVGYLVSSPTMSFWLFIVILAPSSISLLNVALAASNVQREAMQGFESLRGAALETLDLEEKEVLESLLISFQGPQPILTGLGLFQITRPFILSVGGIIVTYFILLYQTRQP